MERDLRKERAIALAAGPLRVWRSRPQTLSLANYRSHSQRAVEFLKRAEKAAQERIQSMGLACQGEEKEFG